jgi:hypothetical protein
MKAKLDVGPFAPKRADPRQQPNLQKGAQQTDLQGPGATVLFDVVYRGLQSIEARPYGGQQFEPFVGDFHAPSAAPKQGHLNIGLQRFDLLADGRRRDIERIGGRGKIQMRGHGLEYSQSSQWQPFVGGWHVKRSLTDGQVMHLLCIGARSNLITVR